MEEFDRIDININDIRQKVISSVSPSPSNSNNETPIKSTAHHRTDLSDAQPLSPSTEQEGGLSSVVEEVLFPLVRQCSASTNLSSSPSPSLPKPTWRSSIQSSNHTDVGRESIPFINASSVEIGLQDHVCNVDSPPPQEGESFPPLSGPLISQKTLISRCEDLTVENERLYMLLWEQDLILKAFQAERLGGGATVENDERSITHTTKSNSHEVDLPPRRDDAGEDKPLTKGGCGCLAMDEGKGMNVLSVLRELHEMMSDVVREGDRTTTLRLADRKAAWQQCSDHLEQKLKETQRLLTALLDETSCQTTNGCNKKECGQMDTGTPRLPLCMLAMIQSVSSACLAFDTLISLKQEIFLKV